MSFSKNGLTLVSPLRVGTAYETHSVPVDGPQRAISKILDPSSSAVAEQRQARASGDNGLLLVHVPVRLCVYRKGLPPGQGARTTLHEVPTGGDARRASTVRPRFGPASPPAGCRGKPGVEYYRGPGQAQAERPDTKIAVRVWGRTTRKVACPGTGYSSAAAGPARQTP